MEEKAAKKILKDIKFPGGTCATFRVYSWSAGISQARYIKNGGLAGSKIISRVAAAAEKAGFIATGRDDMSTSDGSRLGSGVTLVHPQTSVTVYYSRSYGAVASDNCFDIMVAFPD